MMLVESRWTRLLPLKVDMDHDKYKSPLDYPTLLCTCIFLQAYNTSKNIASSNFLIISSWSFFLNTKIFRVFSMETW